MEKTFRSKSLICGCCGLRFNTRKGYKDQDQDDGYGICRGCQKADNKRNRDQYEEIYQTVYNSLNQTNKDKCDQKIKEQGNKYKIFLVNIALDKGWVKWQIG